MPHALSAAAAAGVNIETHCATTDRKVWSKKILSMRDKAFILLCLINYGAELVKAEKMVRNKWFDLDHQGSNQLTDLFCYCSKQKCVHGQMRTTKTYR
jgi:hypothetical protein